MFRQQYQNCVRAHLLRYSIEREIEIETPEVKSEIEIKGEPDPLEQVLREQRGYAQRLSLQVKEIWEREIAGRPKLKAATFEDYQIRLSEDTQPELCRHDRQLLEYSEGEYQAYGLTEQDCIAMEQFSQRLQQQALAELQLLQQREEEQALKEQAQSGDRDFER